MTEPVREHSSDSRRDLARAAATAASDGTWSAPALALPGLALPGSGGMVRRAKDRPARKAVANSRYSNENMAKLGVSKNTRPTRAAASYNRQSASDKIVPKSDRNNQPIWSGGRKGMRFFKNVTTAMEKNRTQCEIQRNGCTGAPDAIDHRQDFSTLKSGVPTRVICDGTMHWHGGLKDDALVIYNGGNEEDTAEGDLDLSNFQWSCKQCNSSKSGSKDMDSPGPKPVGPCPGGTDCDDGTIVG